MEIKEFLELYPWDPEILKLGKPMDFFWKYQLDLPSHQLWDVLIDTSSLNKRLGLPVMEYQERNGRLFGKTKYMGIPTEWEEVPWEWEYGKTLSNARIYSRGFAKYVRSRYLFTQTPSDTTLLYVYFGWIPKNWFGRLLLYIGMHRIQKLYGKVLNEIVQERKTHTKEGTSSQLPEKKQETVLQEPESLFGRYFLKPTDGSDEGSRFRKLKEIAEQLQQENFPSSLVKKLVVWILQSPEDQLYRIQVKKLAREWEWDPKELLRLFLFGCRYGMFTLSWDVICPHCRGVRSELAHLGEIPQTADCEVCGIDFTTDLSNALEVTFHIHPSIRKVQKRFYCAAEPATKRHIYFQKSLPPHQTYETKLSLLPGTYRLRTGNSKNYSILKIDNTGENEKELVWENANSIGEVHFPSNIQLKLLNKEESSIPFIIESREEDQNALRVGEILSFKEFRSLFSEESIQAGVVLDVGLQTILFSDIVGSTDLYQKYGDAKVFQEVRNHFVEVFRISEKNNGVVIKTIGDAAMVAFPEPLDALKAGIGLQKFFQGSSNPSFIRIRISIHYGMCLGVNFNNGMDYFGNTVNFAAKLQKYSGAGDILISEEYSRIPQVKSTIRTLTREFSIKKIKFYLDKERQQEKFAIRIHIPESKTK